MQQDWAVFLLRRLKQAGVVAGGQAARAQGAGSVQQKAEFDARVAQGAGVGSQAVGVALNKGPDDGVQKFGGKVRYMHGNAEFAA